MHAPGEWRPLIWHLKYLSWINMKEIKRYSLQRVHLDHPLLGFSGARKDGRYRNCAWDVIRLREGISSHLLDKKRLLRFFCSDRFKQPFLPSVSSVSGRDTPVLWSLSLYDAKLSHKNNPSIGRDAFVDYTSNTHSAVIPMRVGMAASDTASPSTRIDLTAQQEQPPIEGIKERATHNDWLLWLCQLIHCAVSLCATHPSPAPIRFYWFRAFSRTDHRPLKNTFTVALWINLRHPISVDGRRMVSWGD